MVGFWPRRWTNNSRTILAQRLTDIKRFINLKVNVLLDISIYIYCEIAYCN